MVLSSRFFFSITSLDMLSVISLSCMFWVVVVINYKNGDIEEGLKSAG